MMDGGQENRVRGTGQCISSHPVFLTAPVLVPLASILTAGPFALPFYFPASNSAAACWISSIRS